MQGALEMDITVKAEGANAFNVAGETVETLRFSRTTNIDPFDLWHDELRTISVTGKISADLGADPKDETINAIKWALVPATHPGAYQKISASVVAAGQAAGQYEFNKGFVLSYSERFTDQSGAGTFSLAVRELNPVPPSVKVASASNVAMVAAAGPAFPDNSEAVFSTVSRTGQRSEDFRSKMTFTGDSTIWTVNDSDGTTLSYELMLNMGYRWEKVEPITRPRRLFPSVRGDVTIGSEMYYTRHLAGVEIRGTDQRMYSYNPGVRGVLPLAYPLYSAYLVGGSSYVIDPVSFFEGLGIRREDVRREAGRYVVPVGGRSIGVARVREAGFILENVLVRDVHSGLGAALGFDLAWEQQRRTAVVTLRGTEKENGTSASVTDTIVYATLGNAVASINFMTQDKLEANALYVYTFLSGRGWTNNAIAAVLGNMQKESILNPGAWENVNVTSGGVSGYGLLQWTPSGNKFLSGRTAEWANDLAINNPKELMDLQLEYFVDSIRPGRGEWFQGDTWRSAIDFFPPPDGALAGMTHQEFASSTTHSVRDLTLIFNAIYLRSADHQSPQGRQRLQERIDNANRWHGFLAQQ